MRKLLLAAAAAAAAALGTGLAGVAYAQQGGGGGVSLKPDDVIAARQAAFDLMAGTLIGMKAAVDGNQDVKQLVDPAKGIASWGRSIPNMFPDGTQQGHNTKARPEVWSDRANFEKAAANLVAAADRLSQLAEANDKSGFATQYQAMTQACGACHRSYRAR